MPENQNPATKSAPEAAPGEFTFTKPETENPRIKRRSLKAKSVGLIKPAPAALPAARELEREAPPHSSEPATRTAAEQTAAPVAKVTAVAPPRVTPIGVASAGSASKPATSTAPAAGPASSPHGTRPATLYYSTNSRPAETPSPMKTIPSASSATPVSSPTAAPVSTARPVATATSRPAPNVDYRANVERQSREQKSVGNILSYIVYGLIAFFVISAGLAVYGADIIFKQLHDQSATVSDLDSHYTKVTNDLATKLSATQDTLTAAQAQIARQQDLIVKQQEELNRLIAAASDNDAAIKAERQARAQDAASLRARVKQLEVKESEDRASLQKY